MENVKLYVEDLFGMVRDLPKNLVKDFNFKNWQGWKVYFFIGLIVLQLFFLDFKGGWLAILGSIVAIVNIFCVGLMANEKISTFYFGVIYSVGYLVIAIDNNLKGEIFTTMFFFIMNFVGYVAWHRSIQKEDIRTDEEKRLDMVGRKLLDGKKSVGYNVKNMLIVIIVYVFVYLGLVEVLTYLNSNKPLVDASLVAVTFIAQILATKRYRENWILWIISNILMIILYHDLSIQMVVMSVALTINSIVGYIEFTKSAKEYELSHKL